MRSPAAALDGVRVVVTRAAHQAEGLLDLFRAAGARTVALPLLEVVPPDDPRAMERAAAELPLYDWLVFSSPNAVASFLPQTGGALPDRLRLAAIGEATAAALGDRGVRVDLVAGRSRAEGLVEALAPRVTRRQRVLIPLAADARPTLAEGLAAAGAEVVRVVAYRKRVPAESARRARALLAGGPLGWVTFTSPSTVRHLISLLGTDWPARRPGLLAASIGPVTSGELRRVGVEPAAEAIRPGDRELVEAVAAAEARRRKVAR